MKWLLESFTRPSAKNESIRVQRIFGRWYVGVRGTGQASTYLNAMWHNAFKRVYKAHPTTVNVLMLGLGAGGGVGILYRYFPRCTITAVEYDPEMIRLAKELRLYEPYPLPCIIEGDAAQVVPSLAARYDLIVVDLFFGAEPSPLVAQTAFQQSLKDRLAKDGLLLANVYKRADYIAALSETFVPVETWTYKWNALGLFRARM